MNKTAYTQFEKLGSIAYFTIIISQIYKLLPFISNKIILLFSKVILLVIK